MLTVNDPVLFEVQADATLPERATVGSFGYDLAVFGDHIFLPHETKVIPTGLRLAQSLLTMAMLILPRSSLALNHGLIVANSPGLVDSDYTGPIGIVLYNLRDTAVQLVHGTRVAHAVFIQVCLPNVEQSDFVQRVERGGYGSTGL